MGMGPQEQLTVAHLAQQVTSDPGVSWELFKWVILIALGYTTGAYGLFWKLLAVLREDRKDAREGRKDIWDALDAVKTNDIQHLKDEIAELKRNR